VSRLIELPVHGIRIVLGPPDGDRPGAYQGGYIESRLLEGLPTPDDHKADDDDRSYRIAASALLAIILAHAIAGGEVQTPAYLEGLETTLDDLANQYS
jgi:hypothetical protein